VCVILLYIIMSCARALSGSGSGVKFALADLVKKVSTENKIITLMNVSANAFHNHQLLRFLQ
jgi:hypothetical protein